MNQTITYAGAMELIGTTTLRTYLPFGVGVIVDSGTPPRTLLYFHKDHLGSTTGISNATGTLIETFAFDPWGKRRSVVNGGDLSGTTIAVNDRYGYTGQEALDSLTLVHMNGRVYDPFIGHFVAADPFVPGASRTQSYNRYAYVLNRPTIAVDPTGYADISVESIGRECRAACARLFDLWQHVRSLQFQQFNVVGREYRRQASLVTSPQQLASLQAQAQVADAIQQAVATLNQLFASVAPALPSAAAGTGAELGSITLSETLSLLGRLLGPISLAIVPSQLGDSSIYQMYRVVGPAELADIQTTGQFAFAPGMMEAKQFAISLRDAEYFRDQVIGKLEPVDQLSIVRTTVSGTTWRMLDMTPADFRPVITVTSSTLPPVNVDARQFGIWKIP